ncbi:hypothetical protein BSL78_17379 [Apostichopus japonicus]|uniref:Uncharacterized protein n=1 Tax=Stichopus japonicus TaxID=307972 RepID=A0A2G8KCQ3_STIJA|nr:hypothetical protein BSL78_17379 [Apostichopus japonicus]
MILGARNYFPNRGSSLIVSRRECKQARDVRNPFLRNADLSPDLQGSVDIKLKLGFIEPVKPRSQNRLKKVMLYDNVCEQRKLELNLVKLSTEEKRCVENIIHRKAEFVELLAKNAAVSSNRSKQRPSSESTYGRRNHLISTRHEGDYIPGLRLEASSKPVREIEVWS